MPPLRLVRFFALCVASLFLEKNTLPLWVWLPLRSSGFTNVWRDQLFDEKPSDGSSFCVKIFGREQPLSVNRRVVRTMLKNKEH